MAFDTQGNLDVAEPDGGNSFNAVIEDFDATGSERVFYSNPNALEFLAFEPEPPFFLGEAAVGNGVAYLSFSNGNFFGYYSFLADPACLYHFDLGFEYIFNAGDGQGGVYFYDFASSTYFYTSPYFPFPCRYDSTRTRCSTIILTRTTPGTTTLTGALLLRLRHRQD